jgi:hypothetical protein
MGMRKRIDRERPGAIVEIGLQEISLFRERMGLGASNESGAELVAHCDNQIERDARKRAAETAEPRRDKPCGGLTGAH